MVIDVHVDLRSFRDRPGLKMTAVSEWDAISGSEKRRGVDSPSNPFFTRREVRGHFGQAKVSDG